MLISKLQEQQKLRIVKGTCEIKLIRDLRKTNKKHLISEMKQCIISLLLNQGIIAEIFLVTIFLIRVTENHFHYEECK